MLYFLTVRGRRKQTFCSDTIQANLDTLQNAVGEIRKELEQKKKESKPDGTATAGTSTPNLSPTGGTITTRNNSRPGTGKDVLGFLTEISVPDNFQSQVVRE